MNTILKMTLVALVIPGGVFAIDFESGKSEGLLESRRDWFSTGADNSLQREGGLFRLASKRRAKQLYTASEDTNVHAHIRGSSAKRLRNYTYSGQMKIVEDGGGIGVTFHSQYPREDAYYRLRRYAGSPSFHIAPHGTSVSSGEIDSGVNPSGGEWYSFKVLVRTFRTRTRIRAKVWSRNQGIPGQWQVDTIDESDTRIRRGRPGVWSMGTGRKLWRKLKVRSR